MGKADGEKATADFGGACLRRMEYKNLISTAMIFDDLPAITYFRAVNDRMIAGVMESKDFGKGVLSTFTLCGDCLSSTHRQLHCAARHKLLRHDTRYFTRYDMNCWIGWWDWDWSDGWSLHCIFFFRISCLALSVTVALHYSA